jgi:transcriptional regulator with XRE-family HTH domain
MKESERKYLNRLGRVIRSLRLRFGYSQEMLALHSGIDRSYIGAVERGERNPSILTLCRLALALNVPITALLPPTLATGRRSDQLRSQHLDLPNREEPQRWT